ncbi:hypothetical protein T03_13817 [Trichinella britovi]|uniref:Uncharacterized protein n=1 Tax=Trichinella britovi TaxID=45882 RepID=A0A0V1CWL9_TRIBR|nr:hypothetical protein T03_13817 [Trichinella britovi]
MKRADAVLNQVCNLTINHHKLSSGTPTGAAAYHHDVYAAHLEKHLHNNAILRSTSDAEEEEVEGCSAISATLLSF